ncbi:MAG TPA: ribose-phosphate pyrophosphokinase [Rhabdochlamydiaceae bacterium]|nr:ribose-phosphate pyrophosphokinase [Rhabdochlamydiaceae bacterium]
MPRDRSFVLFAGSSHPELAGQVADWLGVKLGNIAIDTFPDGEIGIQILENVRGRDVFVLQSIAQRPNHYLMELLIIIDALKRASARSIGVVLPYYGYARQDRRDKGRVPITAKLVANVLERAGATRGLTMDLHAAQVEGFFDIPIDNLLARPVLVEAVEKAGLEDYVVVAPDLGSIKLARAFAGAVKTDLAIVDKRRVSAERVEAEALIGKVENRNILLVDDMVSTGVTLNIASRVCKKAGAKRIFAVATHGLFVGHGFEESAIEKMLVTNTVPSSKKDKKSRIEVVSVAPLFGKAIEFIAEAKSISSLYN